MDMVDKIIARFQALIEKENQRWAKKKDKASPKVIAEFCSTFKSSYKLGYEIFPIYNKQGDPRWQDDALKAFLYQLEIHERFSIMRGIANFQRIVKRVEEGNNLGRDQVQMANSAGYVLGIYFFICDRYIASAPQAFDEQNRNKILDTNRELVQEIYDSNIMINLKEKKAALISMRLAYEFVASCFKEMRREDGQKPVVENELLLEQMATQFHRGQYEM